MADYGPNQASVERLMLMAETLNHERLRRIADAYKSSGYPRPLYALVVAAKEGRLEQVRLARSHVAMSLNLCAILMDFDQTMVDYAARAASNASVALVTEDLIGSMSYGMTEYGRLVEPWFKGFGELPNTREGRVA